MPEPKGEKSDLELFSKPSLDLTPEEVAAVRARLRATVDKFRLARVEHIAEKAAAKVKVKSTRKRKTKAEPEAEEDVLE